MLQWYCVVRGYNSPVACSEIFVGEQLGRDPPACEGDGDVAFVSIVPSSPSWAEASWALGARPLKGLWSPLASFPRPGGLGEGSGRALGPVGASHFPPYTRQKLASLVPLVHRLHATATHY